MDTALWLGIGWVSYLLLGLRLVGCQHLNLGWGWEPALAWGRRLHLGSCHHSSLDSVSFLPIYFLPTPASQPHSSLFPFLPTSFLPTTFLPISIPPYPIPPYPIPPYLIPPFPIPPYPHFLLLPTPLLPTPIPPLPYSSPPYYPYPLPLPLTLLPKNTSLLQKRSRRSSRVTRQ